MKTLYLLRHADAEPAADYDDDRDRELSSEGQSDAQRLGRFLAATDQLPDQILTSPATRARQTVDALPVGGDWGIEVPLRSSASLYRAQPADVLEEVQATDDGVGALLVVGHEPTWSTTVSQLVGAANVSLSVGTCVRIDAKIDRWSDLQFGDGTLHWMIPPALIM